MYLDSQQMVKNAEFKTVKLELIDLKICHASALGDLQAVYAKNPNQYLILELKLHVHPYPISK